ncbi:DUF2924 domain-containing protein [Rhizobium sp. FKL33]|uniref:DUF2924 domain-containing protein n=1 Tax=Rhizobium sp. FKL33 TaxID=2562307 RepID=UPI001485BDB1|nr:DUF2924 domain-containing protein [Rhizobium sp. FKL33]
MAKRKPVLEHQLQALDRLPRADLIDLWRKRYGAPPPSGVRQPLLIRSAAWRIQEDMVGGLSVGCVFRRNGTVVSLNRGQQFH